jgi:hypothetical protein
VGGSDFATSFAKATKVKKATTDKGRKRSVGEDAGGLETLVRKTFLKIITNLVTLLLHLFRFY